MSGGTEDDRILLTPIVLSKRKSMEEGCTNKLDLGKNDIKGVRFHCSTGRRTRDESKGEQGPRSRPSTGNKKGLEV